MPAYSYSAIQQYQNCPKQYFHERIAKDAPKQPESEQQAEGKRIHKALELRVKNGKSLPLDLKPLEPIAAKLAGSPGEIYTEMKLAVTEELKPTGWFEKDVWFRSVVDLAIVNDKNALIIDYKTGKVKEDYSQLLLSAAVLMHYEEEIELVKAAYVWTSNRKVSPTHLHRDDIMEVWANYLPIINEIEEATEASEFPAKPSPLCAWCSITKCSYHPKHGRG